MTTSNSLSLDTKKTQEIVFGSSHTLNLFRQLNISKVEVNCLGDSVPFVDEVTSLGVILDSTLSWVSQVQHVTKKVNRALYGLKVIRPWTSLSLRKRLIESLVVPYLNYCCLVYSDTTKNLSGQLQRLLNSSIRYIYGIRHDEHITPYELDACYNQERLLCISNHI